MIHLNLRNVKLQTVIFSPGQVSKGIRRCLLIGLKQGSLIGIILTHSHDLRNSKSGRPIIILTDHFVANVVA